jgi:undecaprenyl-phosphate galactose phosphotransferase
LFQFGASRLARSGRDWKRIVDVTGALLGLVFFGPIMLIIYVLLLAMGGCPIFVHSRVGQHGRLFRCYKFRSMTRDSEAAIARHLAADPAAREEWERAYKLTNDPRITPFGAFLRKTSLDELPQLFNVLKGDMSLVGPRPIVPEEVERYSCFIDAYYSCRPGITGLWQVSGRNLIDYDRRVHLDADYARKHSIQLDFAILMRTVWAVLSRRGAL